MKVRLDDEHDGRFAANWLLVLNRVGNLYSVHVERETPSGMQVMSPEQACDTFALLATRSRPVSEKVAILVPKK